ncbi:hypothetical protein ABZ816_01215 [Actinosynnema sp. NPDC047251]|uniref:Putative membrane protein n=1 Tax=Saccharothrix espanaensis (strain ATCC 51144 / DSM 44229 / JCM 9112 / NBRC 15066 / NRRL 15764) TaxID=1179773 RepID=K0JSY6_SACES|nr:hypothetical protein [Saccharothrix espanaensis]CCH30870.1 putative membrane protein [Saccharothrix espanaensis DSM 44229]
MGRDDRLVGREYRLVRPEKAGGRSMYLIGVVLAASAPVVIKMALDEDPPLSWWLYALVFGGMTFLGVAGVGLVFATARTARLVSRLTSTGRPAVARVVEAGPHDDGEQEITKAVLSVAVPGGHAFEVTLHSHDPRYRAGAEIPVLIDTTLRVYLIVD